MIDKLFGNDFGAYLPGFFKIELDLELHDNFKWEEFTDSQKATVIHEYIHYLQDISTTHGFSNFNFIAQSINLYLHVAGSSKSNEVIVPIDLESSETENACKQSELIGIYEGDTRNKKIHHINKIVREIEDCYGFEEKMYNINIYYDNKKDPYVFGNRCILESMAYLIEISMYPTELRKNEFPYNSCEVVCENIYPEIGGKISCIVAMCEIALMHYHSGDFFYQLLIDMKKNNYIPQNASDVYRYTIPRVEHLYKNFKQDFSEVVKNIDFLYPEDVKIAKSVSVWLRNKIELGKELRLRYPNFISKLLDFSNTKDSEKYFLLLMNIFELPLITDKMGGAFSVNDNLSLMLVPIAIAQLFSKASDFKCYMYRYCIANNEPQVCEICLENPWKQAEKEQLCPLALYWYKFGLEEKILKRN